MSFLRVAPPVIAIAIVLALLVTLLPAATFAADRGGKQLYMVSLDVTGAGRIIKPSSKRNRERIGARAERVKKTSERLGKEHGVWIKHRFSSAGTGFSARMTAAEARAMAKDDAVVSVRPARRATFAAQRVDVGIERVKATYAGSGSDVDVDVAVLDTGIGPSEVDIFGFETGEPMSMSNQPPQNKPELKIMGGVNCSDGTQDGRWADTNGHGTHVAGIIGARDNSVGTLGVAPGARLWSVRVFDGFYGDEATVACGLAWVVARNSNADPSDDIEVINMSLEISRIDSEEDCAVVLANPAGDPVQKGVCEAIALGVTVVAAAGNSSQNANLWAPGGFDDVITVGGMTDTDGIGGGTGGNATCGGSASEGDDTYATGYSNWGTDVDIVAPGTCVRSTWPSVSGDSTRLMTGTSMSTPHVTGAVARHLADHPSISPRKMARLVRASGQLNWDLKSDPVWSGVNDGDPPNRLLDVAWLLGSPRIKTWIYDTDQTVGGGETSRKVRVDVQRGGGYADAVTLSKSGVPSGATGTFEDKTLVGIDRPRDLGTNLVYDFGLGVAEGRFDVTVKADGAGVDRAERTMQLTVDRTPPWVSSLAPKIRLTTLYKSGSARVNLLWKVSDALTGVASSTLQRKIGSGSYKNVRSDGPTRADAMLYPSQKNLFRVKAKDRAGNTRWSSSISAKLGVRDSSSSQWSKPSAWKTVKNGDAYGGSILMAKGQAGTLSSSFYGRAVAIAASVGPSRGKFKVRVDGGPWQKVSLQAAKGKHRQIVWGKQLTKGAHTIDIRGVYGQSTFDALLFVR